MHKNLVTLAVGAALALAASGAFADQAGPNEVRLGMYFVHYETEASDISGPYTPPGLNVHLDNVETLYAAYVRTLSAHFVAEVAFGYPPLTKTEGRGPAKLGSVAYNGQVISTARWVAPTLLIEYVFGSPSSRLRPYVGFGVNYTKFVARQSTTAGNAASGGPTSISLPASVGPAATAGLSCEITDRWHVYASYSIAQVNSKLTADTAGILRTSEIHFWPNTLVISAGYSF
ncbi:MAG TPA: OmpW family outer membrane protein [Steroidobacteraceae bacterium]|jgi:outer membrane protein|nr:OmpW family outer membrane protein [Steroidobacteraceae bacterium]